MAGFLVALVLIVVMGGVLVAPVVARSRPQGRLARAMRGIGGWHNDLYLAGHQADDEAPAWAVPGDPPDDEWDRLLRETPADWRRSAR
jgi:hypothetical protein